MKTGEGSSPPCHMEMGDRRHAPPHSSICCSHFVVVPEATGSVGQKMSFVLAHNRKTHNMSYGVSSWLLKEQTSFLLEHSLPAMFPMALPCFSVS